MPAPLRITNLLKMASAKSPNLALSQVLLLYLRTPGCLQGKRGRREQTTSAGASDLPPVGELWTNHCSFTHPTIIERLLGTDRAGGAHVLTGLTRGDVTHLSLLWIALGSGGYGPSPRSLV